jgi:hypothetical protein
MSEGESSRLEGFIATLEQARAVAPYSEIPETELLELLRRNSAIADDAAETWEDIARELRQPVVRKGYVYEWNIFRRTLCITRLPGSIECERISELYARSTPEEIRRRIRGLTGIQFEEFLRSLLAVEPTLKNVTLTRASHDGGIDLKGRFIRGHLLPELPMIGQAKQIAASVSASMARDFIGALDTCGEAKPVVGLYVSTSGFTAPAADALSRCKYHVMTWDLEEVTKRALAAGVGVVKVELPLLLADDTFWDELSGKS